MGAAPDAVDLARQSVLPGERIRVAYMITPLGDGGADQQLVDLLRRLDRKRFTPVLYVSEAHDHVVNELPLLDADVVNLGGKKTNERNTMRLVPLLQRQRPHIIHSMLFVANTWARIAGRLARVPVIITSELGLTPGMKPSYRRLDMLLAPLADRTIVNAHVLASHLHRTRYIPQHKIVTIYSGVDSERYRSPLGQAAARQSFNLTGATAVVGMAARFVALKRWDIFLDAIELLRASRPVVVLCAGDGPLLSRMQSTAIARGLGECVLFVGFQPNMPAFMHALDVFVHTSESEGMPGVVLEAMAAGRPVVATDAGGTREAVLHGETGFITPIGDARAIARGILTLLDDPAMAARFGAAGQQRARKLFSAERRVTHIQSLYEDLLAEKLA